MAKTEKWRIHSSKIGLMYGWLDAYCAGFKLGLGVGKIKRHGVDLLC